MSKIISHYQNNEKIPLTRKQLLKEVGLSNSALSKHLKFFRNKGIISVESRFIDKTHRAKCVFLNPIPKNLLDFLYTYYVHSKTREIIRRFLLSLPDGDYKYSLCWFISLKMQAKEMAKNDEHKHKFVFILDLIREIQRQVVHYSYASTETKEKIKKDLTDLLTLLNSELSYLSLQNMSECQRYAFNIVLQEVRKLINSNFLLSDISSTNNLFGII